MWLIADFARLRSYWIPLREVRAETWALGVRHHGRVVEGALIEARAPGVSFRRAILLRAVIRGQTAAVAAQAGPAKAQS